jgi:hypothetical protein
MSRPKAKTKCGILEVKDPSGAIVARVECYVLEDGRRVISQVGAVRALSGNATAKDGQIGRYIARLPSRFAELASTPSVEIERLEGGVAIGRDARWFVRLCNAYLDARRAGELLLVSSSKDQFWELWQTYCTGRGQLRLGW